MSLEPEKLQLTVWHEPDGNCFVGDQHGRPIENVTNFSLNRSVHQPSEFKLEARHVATKRLDIVHKVANASAPALKVRVKGKPAEEISLRKDGLQRVVKLEWPRDQPPMTCEMAEEFQRHVKQVMGQDTIVLLLPEGAKLDIIELRRESDSESASTPIDPNRPEAEWNF